jgi:hypothetical protein
MNSTQFRKLVFDLQEHWPPSATEKLWNESHCGWIRAKASGAKGKIAVQIASRVMQAAGYKPHADEGGIKVNDRFLIVRSSFMWGKNCWKFQQIRDTNFHYLLCLGFHPRDDAYIWLIPSHRIYVDGVLQKNPGLGRQHGGKQGREDAWLHIESMNPLGGWTGEYGSHIADVAGIFEKYLHPLEVAQRGQ